MVLEKNLESPLDSKEIKPVNPKVEGFRVTLVDEGDLYNWKVAIFGPPNTYYEGGYFKVCFSGTLLLFL